MNTVVGQLTDDVDELKELFKDFLLNYSKIKYEPHESDGTFVVVGFSDYEWAELNPEGKQLQSRLYKQYNYFVELVRVLISDLVKDSINDFDANAKKVFSYIEHRDVWISSTKEVLDEVNKCLETQLDLLNNLYDFKAGSNIFIPDTNALILNPNLEKWNFSDVPIFEIVLVPTVLSELDKLKMFHKNKDVRDKAQGIINRIKELRRRGKLTEGVVLVKNKSTLRALAVEPNFNKTFSWLDINNNDDRILASLIEVMKLHPKTVVTLVTSDINFQNKAEFARIPFTEPPDIDSD